MKLISCTDFVLEQEKKGMQNTDRPLRFERILKYAKFLKQPLTLSMFVPTDDEGNVMKEAYEVFERDCTECDEYIFRHQQAKERIIFEGFDGRYSESGYQVSNENILIVFYDAGYIVTYKSCFDYKTETIESVIQFNLTITPNAVKTYQL